MADDVEIVPYDPAWPALFATEARRLRAALDATPIVEAYRYEVLKRDLAARFPADREAYTGAKTEYVKAVYLKIGLDCRRKHLT